MGTSEFIRLVHEILKYRASGWTDLSKDVIRLLAKKALQNGEITQEEYNHLIKMLENDHELPPPSYDRSKKNKLD